MVDLTKYVLWRNLVIRTIIWYLVCGPIAWVLRSFAPSSWGSLGDDTLGSIVGGAPSVLSGGDPTAPTALAATIAMLTAFVTALPVTWIYTLTRRKKGFQQSVVQTYLILPVVAAGIVVMVKHSLALAFALGGIVAAVRFRTTLDDSKDAAGIFVVIAIGMAAAVTPSVSFVISIGFNLLMLFLWSTDFGKPAALEGRLAERQLEKALAGHNRTGMFLAKIDDELLKQMSPEQLEALSDRAWRRMKRNDPEWEDDDDTDSPRPQFEALLRVKSVDVGLARKLCEPRFDALFTDWRFLGTVTENDVRVLEYGVTLAETVTPGVVSDDLSGLPDSPLRGVEMR